MTCAKKLEHVRSWASLRLDCLKRTILLCYERHSVMLSTDVPVWCGGVPWRWGPLCQKAGGLQKVLPTTSWIWQLEFGTYTRGSHNQDRAGKANGANCAPAQAVILGRGWLVRKTPQVCCNITRFKSTEKVFSFVQSSTWPPIPVKCYIHRSAVRPRTTSQRTQSWLCWEV